MLLGSGRVGSDDLGHGPGSGFSFEPVQTSSKHCQKLHDHWERFEEDVDDVVPLAVRSIECATEEHIMVGVRVRVRLIFKVNIFFFLWLCVGMGKINSGLCKTGTGEFQILVFIISCFIFRLTQNEVHDLNNSSDATASSYRMHRDNYTAEGLQDTFPAAQTFHGVPLTGQFSKSAVFV